MEEGQRFLTKPVEGKHFPLRSGQLGLSDSKAMDPVHHIPMYL